MQGRMTSGIWRTAAALCALLLGGCTVSNALRQEPIASVWRTDAPMSRAVYFATDREAEGESFNLHWGGALRCGRATLAIPAIADGARSPAVTSESCDDPGPFVRRIAAEANGCGGLLVLVPGYNATFGGVALRAAQIALDLQWRCPVLVFSWSSEGRFNRYMADVERSGYGTPALMALLRELRTAQVKTSLVAHSMGARMALAAAAGLCRDKAVLLDQLVLAAADVSAEKYNDDFGRLLERASGCIARTTVYASANDTALIMSESFHGGVPRIGQLPLYVGDHGAELVDASLAPGDIAGHGYFAASYEMLNDMMWVLAGASRADRADKGLLVCSEAAASGCGHYALAVTEARHPDWTSRLLRHLWPFILPAQ